MAKPWKIVDLDPLDTLKVCACRIAETRLQEMLSYEHRTIIGEDGEALHDMRVSARRLRAILRICRDCFPRKKFKKVDERLQGIVRALGSVREQDVFLALLEDVRRATSPHERKALDLLIAREQNARKSERESLHRTLQKLRRSGFVDTFRSFLNRTL
jgi:CHAD domain-containing protein